MKVSREWRWRKHTSGRWHVFRFRLALISACGCVSGEPEPAEEPDGSRYPAGKETCGTCCRMYKTALRASLKASLIDRQKNRLDG